MADPPQKATGPEAGRQRGYTLRYPASRQWAIACTVFLILMGLTFALVVITKVAIVVGALTAITWLIWQFLAHANAKALSGRGEWLMPALGVACWFVPGLNLILPPLIMRSLLRTSDPDAVSAEGTRRGLGAILLHLVNSRQVMKEDRLIYREWVGWSESA
jgi:hypothetical protein